MCIDSLYSLGVGGKYNCLITLTRALSPQLMRRCSTLVHYDADDVTGIDDVVSQHRLQCFVLRSVQTQTRFSENTGLIIY